MIERLGYGTKNLEIESEETTLMDVIEGLYTPLVAFHDTNEVQTTFLNMKNFLLISQRFIHAELGTFIDKIKL